MNDITAIHTHTKCSTISNLNTDIFNADKTGAVRELPLWGKEPAVMIGWGHYSVAIIWTYFFQDHEHTGPKSLGQQAHKHTLGFGVQITGDLDLYSVDCEERTPSVSKDPVTGLPIFILTLTMKPQGHITNLSIW